MSSSVNTYTTDANPKRHVRTWTQLNDGNNANNGNNGNNGRTVLMEPLVWKVSPNTVPSLVRSEPVRLTSPFDQNVKKTE